MPRGKLSKTFETVEEWLDALTPDERWRLFQAMLRQSQGAIEAALTERSK